MWMPTVTGNVVRHLRAKCCYAATLFVHAWRASFNSENNSRMTIKRFQMLRRLRCASRARTLMLLLCLLLLPLLSLAWQLRRTRTREWKPAEVPIAFWSWRRAAPAQAEVDKAKAETGARTLFLRAGQIDAKDGMLRRTRPSVGQFPSGIRLHLVYNATRSLLANFERIDDEALAAIICKVYAEDAARAASDRSNVVGIQLDFDIPTRLLPRYASLLRRVRAQLPQGTQLSITGLPTWIDSAQIDELLASVDFWIPQCYGAIIPDELQKIIPISSTQALRSIIKRVRQVGRPFYAGLPDYGYAILYSPDGKLIALRGDLDPLKVARHTQLELIEQRAFGAETLDDDEGKNASEWRRIYRATSDDVLDGLSMRAGDYLMLDVPRGEWLRALAGVVRKEAGENLLGICIFRLPDPADPTTLTFRQVAAAMQDVPASDQATLKTDAMMRAGGWREYEEGQTLIKANGDKR